MNTFIFVFPTIVVGEKNNQRIIEEAENIKEAIDRVFRYCIKKYPCIVFEFSGRLLVKKHNFLTGKFRIKE